MIIEFNLQLKRLIAVLFFGSNTCNATLNCIRITVVGLGVRQEIYRETPN
jgi:hypothetical protein